VHHRDRPVRCSVAVSEHPLPTEATGEVAGQLLEAGAAGADLLVVAVSPALGGALEDVGGALWRLLGPRHSLGVCTTAVLGGGRCLGETGVAALAVSGVACRTTRVEASTSPPGRDVPLDAPSLVIAPLGSSVPRLDPGLVGGHPVLTPRARRTPPGAIWLDGRAAELGASVWCEPGSGAQVVELGGWRPLGPPRSAGGSPHRLATLDGLAAAEVVLAELSALDPELRSDVADVALRSGEGTEVRRLIGIGAEARSDAVRTSVAVPDGAAVEVVVRCTSSVGAELLAVLEQRRGAGAVVCSPLLGTGAPGSPQVGDGFALRGAVARATGGQALIGLALGAATLPAPVVMMVW
jgi:hypothetical protein